MKILRILIFLVVLLPRWGAAQEPGERITVYLLTMGQGDAVWEKYGHNALWLHDEAAGTDWVFNYGVFDFDSPGYWSRFIEGDWLYQLAVSDIEQTMAQYRYLNRTVVAQELTLSDAQKAELEDFLHWNYRPENREYLYDYFRDNCSTRIRDAIDRVLDGALQAATGSVPTGTTFRSHSRRLMAGSPIVYTGLNAGLGPEADQPISAWEEMFLPEKLKERVRDVTVVAPDGSARPLVRGERVLYEAVGRAPERQEPPNWTFAYLLIGSLLGVLLAGLGQMAGRSARARAGFAFMGTLWALLVGVGGLLLAGLWAFTNHTAAHRNENLFQFDLLALALVLLLPAALYGARWARRPARLVALAVAAIALLGLILQILPGIDQVNGEIIALMLPATLGLAWGMKKSEG